MPLLEATLPDLDCDRDRERERERERERDWDRDWDLVVGLLPLPLPLPVVELSESAEDALPPLPPLVVSVRPLDLDLDLLVMAFCLCLFCRAAVGLEAFLRYRRDVVVSGRCWEDKVEAVTTEGDSDLDVVLLEASPPAPSPAGGEELVTGANTTFLLTCTSHLPVVPYLAASVSKSI